MFCSNCGHKIEENEMFCSNCGVSVSAAENEQLTEPKVNEIPAEETVVNEVNETETVVATEEISEQPVVSENISGEPEQPKKKRKWTKALVAGIVVVAAAVTAFAFPAVRNVFFRTVLSPEDYFKHVVENNVEDLASDVAGYIAQSKELTSTGAAGNGNMEIIVGDKAKELVAEYGEGVNIDWLNSVGVTYDCFSEISKFNADMGVKLNNTNIVSADVAMDNSMIYLSVPELNDKALRIDMSESVADEEMMNIINSVYEVVPDEKVTEKLLVKYTNNLIEGIEDVSEETVTVTAGGVSKKYLKMSADIDDYAAEKGLEAVLTDAREDEEIEKIIRDVCETDLVDEDADEVYEEFLNVIDKALEELDDNGISYDTDITFNIWVNMKGEIIGAGLDVEDDGEEVAFAYQNVQKGNKLGTILTIEAEGETVKFEGSGEVKKNKFNGEYELKAMGTHILDINIENVDTKLIKDNVFNGKISVKLSSAAGKLLESYDESAALLAKGEVILESTPSNKDELKLKLSVNVDGGLLGAISVNAVKSEPKSIVIPDKYVDVTDDKAMETWAEESMNNLGVLIDKLESAGLPGEYASVIRSSLAGEVNDEPTEAFSADDINAILEPYGVMYFESDGSYMDLETGEMLSEDEVVSRMNEM